MSFFPASKNNWKWFKKCKLFSPSIAAVYKVHDVTIKPYILVYLLQ